MVNQRNLTALIMSCAVPLEVWSGVALSRADYFVAFPLIIVSVLFNFFGIRSWISAQTTEIDREFEDIGRKS